VGGTAIDVEVDELRVGVVGGPRPTGRITQVRAPAERERENRTSVNAKIGGV